MLDPSKPPKVLQSLRTYRVWEYATQSPQRRLSIAAFLILAGLLSKLFWVSGVYWPVRYSFRALFLVLAVALICEHVARWSNEKALVLPKGETSDWPNDFIATKTSSIRLAEQQAIYWSDLTMDQVTTLVGRLTEPREHRVRVIEDIALHQTGMDRTVNQQFQSRTSDQAGLALLPYARPPKGSVLSNLKVVDSNGAQVRTLSYEETTSLLFGVLRLSYVALPKEVGLAVSETEAILGVFAEILTSHTITEETLAPHIAILATGVAIGADDPVWLRFAELVQVCALRRPLIAQLLPGTEQRPIYPTEVLELTYSYNQSLSMGERVTEYADQYEWRKQKLRRAALLPPSVTFIDVSSSRACRSYQARVRPPKGTYIAEATLVDAKTTTPIPNLSHGADYSAFVSWQRGPQKISSDLHTSNFGRTSATRPRYVVRIVEVPPGSVGRAVISSLAVLFAIWVTGVLFSGIAPRVQRDTPPAAATSSTTQVREGEGASTAQNKAAPATSHESPASVTVDQATDVVAFILGIPAVLGAWMAFTAGRNEAFPSLAARVSMIFTGLLSTGSATLYLLHAHKPYTVKQIPGQRNLLFIEEWGWAVMFAFAMVGAVFAFITLAVRTYRYRYMNNAIAIEK